MLMAGVKARLAWATVAVVALWLAVAWALT
jgi:hypothetical protein